LVVCGHDPEFYRFRHWPPTFVAAGTLQGR